MLRIRSTILKISPIAQLRNTPFAVNQSDPVEGDGYDDESTSKVLEGKLERLDLENTPGHLLRRLQQISAANWSIQVSSSVTSAQFAVLNCLIENHGLDQTTLGQLAFLDRATMAELAVRMAKRGLISRDRDPSDRRRWIISITDQGVATHRDMAEKSVNMNSALFSVLNEEEIETLMRLMKRLVTGVQGSGPEPTKQPTDQLPR